MNRKGQFLGNMRQRGRQYVQQSAVGLQGQSAVHSVFLLTLLVHIWDAWTGFQRGGNIFGMFFWVWFFTGIFTWRILSQGQGLNWAGLGQTMIISMIAYVLPLFVGLRYLRAKRRNQFISFITFSSMMGVILGVTALIAVLSVMNGFQNEVRERILA